MLVAALFVALFLERAICVDLFKQKPLQTQFISQSMVQDKSSYPKHTIHILFTRIMNAQGQDLLSTDL